MKITNSKEASHYYNIINKAIDKYIHDWNISIDKLIKYLHEGSKGYKNLLHSHDLENIENINIIINDVLDDRLRGTKDIKNIKLTMFDESNESSDTFDKEKIIANFYGISIGFVTSKGSNIYEVNNFGKIINVLILSKDEIIQIRNEYIDKLVEEYSNISQDLSTIAIKITNADVVNIEKLKENIKSKIPKGTIFNLISKKYDMTFAKNYDNTHYIWKREA